jgi:hypothetical protein
MTKIKASKNHYAGGKGWDSDNELFANVVINHKQWLGASGQHLHAAQLLLPSVISHFETSRQVMKDKISRSIPPIVTGIYFFHCALAVENALKAVIAVKNSTSIQRKINLSTKVPPKVLGHFLVDLASRAGRKIDIDEEFTLEFLTRYGIWGGKYPTPITNKANSVTAQLSDGEHYLVGGYDPEIVPEYLHFASEWYDWASTEANSHM